MKLCKNKKASRDEMHERARHLERLLKKKLSEFLDSSILYGIRRVLPAELNTIYVKNFAQESKTSGDDDESSSSLKSKLNPDLQRLIPKDAKENETKGGYKITEYLTYNWFDSKSKPIIHFVSLNKNKQTKTF